MAEPSTNISKIECSNSPAVAERKKVANKSKLECLSVAKHFVPSLTFVSKIGAYLSPNIFLTRKGQTIYSRIA